MLTTTTREMQEILANDPLVGDTACQNRAVYLAYLARKVRRNKPLKQTELDFIENCRELTEAKQTTRNAFGIITDERGKNLNDLDAIVFPEEAKSNKSKNRYLAQKKQAVAAESLGFLIKKSRGMSFFAPLPTEDNPPSTIAINDVRIPVFPFYVSMKMVLNIVNRKAIDVVALVRRVQGNGDDGVLLGSARVLYTKRDGRYQAMRLNDADEEASLIKEAIKVEFVSKVTQPSEPDKERFEGVQSFDDYLLNFMKKDILQQILLYGGNHSLYPARTKINDTSVFEQEPPVKDEALLFNLDVCSLFEFAELKRLADEAPISRSGDYIDHISTTARPL